MSNSIQKHDIPHGISDYITIHFPDDYLTTVKEYKKVKGQWEYTIEVSKDDIIHSLRFDEEGALLKEETDPFSTLPSPG